ncbi:AAA domain-containing protein [Kitasatospora sp. NPDC051914]|uniref:AAA domain-containing protein n=1 Tax=Kitasatospora sp. NPDC051914 TaxID=3154945 RepID=UPI003438250B
MGWREETISSLDAWLALEGGGGRKPRWRRIGRAVPGTAPGAYAVDVRGLPINADQIQVENLRLAGLDEDGLEAGHPVMDVSQDGTVLRVRVAEFADPTDPWLWLLQQPATFLIESLRKGISGAMEEGLAGLLARGEAGGRPAPVGLPAGVLLPAQDLAYRACLGSGLWLVWGPPGTGKTSVLKRAISDLIADGKRVLLVSATNIAVDNALLGVVKERRHAPGQLVRVGPPHLRDIAEDPQVCLPLMVRAKLSTVDDRRQAVAAELAAVNRRAEQLTAIEAQLAGFDADRHARNSSRLRIPEHTVDHLLAALGRASEQRREVTQAREAAVRRSAVAEAAHHAVADQCAAWEVIDELAYEAETIEAAATAAEGKALVAEQDLAASQERLEALEGKAGLARLKARAAIATAKADMEAAAERSLTASDAARSARALADRRRLQIHAETARLARDLPLGREELQRIADELDGARDAIHCLDTRDDDLAELLLGLDEQLRLSRSAAAEVAEAVRRGHPARHAEAQSLRPQVALDATRRSALLKQHQELHEQYERLARDAQGELIRSARLVATTLARFRTNTAVFEGAYDVVLIDEVGAATLPEVLLAVSKARKTAVLLGDFMQLGPVLPEGLKDNRRPDVRRWLLTEVFKHCGIDTPQAAQQHPGCIALDVQHRFGTDVMRLANTLAYDGLLSAGPSAEARARARGADDAEIVIVDTDGLVDLAQVYRIGAAKGWWPAGVLLSRALADLHRADGDAVGVVTPYTAQAEATLEAMREIEGESGMLAEVGTAHRFQGREFPIVVFDLVEAAHGDGMWMAKAARRPDAGAWVHNGLRLFNVAVTRVQHRLYLVGSRSRIAAAAPDTALGAVRELIEGRLVRTIPAAALIAPHGPVTPHLGPVGSRLAEVLGRHVEITDVQDEVAFRRTFADHLAAARQSIWIWTPWVAARVRTLLPALEDAVRRGVRVTVFVRDPSDHNQQKFAEYLAELKAVVPRVVPVNVMHQKIVVVDDRLVLLGSLNALSQNHSREVMLTIRGSHFARRILQHEHAEDIANPPACGSCKGQEVDLRRGKGGWYWRCYNLACPARKGNRGWRIEARFATDATSRRHGGG